MSAIGCSSYVRLLPSIVRGALVAILVSSLPDGVLCGGELDYAAADPELQVVWIDSAEKESFLGVRLDTTGRIFVGGREALFVYELDERGGYRPRQELYRFPDHTWVNDIAIRGDDLYVSTVSAIYVFEGARVKRKNLKPKRLVWGIPLGHVHQCLHALTWGPEGDLYCSTGDPVWYYGDFSRPDHWGHWSWFTRKAAADRKPGSDEWDRTPYTGVGCVFRVRPDGSRFQVVATGLRNACGLCFDAQWNLFSNDNDHEGLPADYVPGRLLHVAPLADFGWPRGWMPSKTPDRKDLLETMFDGLGRAVPVGQAYYNEPFLPEKYRHNLLVARWCTRTVTRYPIEPRGASFSAKEELPLLTGRDLARPVGVAVGRGGRVFATIAYMPHNDGSPVYKSDLVMITRADDSDTHPFEPYDCVTASHEKLLDELANRSCERKYNAHVEIFRRGGPVLEELRRRSRLPNSNNFTNDPTLDSVGGLAKARSDDSYERQIATRLLGDRMIPRELAPLCESSDVRSRMAGVLAVGHRLTVPKSIGEVPADLPLADPRGPEIEYADEKVNLRKLGRIGNFTMAEWWKAVQHTAEQEQLFSLLRDRLKDGDEAVRLQAAYFLSLLNDPRSEPRVKEVRAHTAEQRLANGTTKGVGKVWIAGPFPDGDQGFSAVHAPQRGPVDVGAKYGVANAEPVSWKQVTMQRMVQFNEHYSPLDRSSCFAYFRLESARTQPVHLLVGSDDGVQVWHNGADVWKNDVSRGALPFQDVVRITLQPGANDILVRVRNQTGVSGLYLHYKSLEPLGETLPEPLGDLAQRLAEAAKAGGTTAIPDEFLKIDWTQATTDGDAERGEKLFQSIGCVKCHAVKLDAAASGGPSLADATKRFTSAYLVESILLPNKTVSPIFRATQVVTTNGRVVIGLVVGETAEQLELLLPDAKREIIKTADIEQRKQQEISPMPAGLVKTTQELRDLLAYLLSSAKS